MGCLFVDSPDHSNEPLLGFNWVPGTQDDQSAYLSELSGIDGFLTMFEVIVFYHGLTCGFLTIGIDCLPAMDRARSTLPLCSDLPNFDLLQDIHYQIWALLIELRWRHVPSHQDWHTSYDKLDWWAQRNIDMDKRAKDFALLCHRQHRPFSSPQLL